MTMDKAIRGFNKQFSFEPEIINAEKLSSKFHFVVGGMGGSGLAVELLRCGKSDIDIRSHHNYGIPEIVEYSPEDSLYIASSYSGNTEETIDFMDTAYERGLSVIAYSTGGKLLDMARKNELPYIVLPDTGIQPRSALGFSILAIAKIIKEDEVYKELHNLGTVLSPDSYEDKGKGLAKSLSNSVPVIYSSERNKSVANNWKIKFNETGKVPSYYNVFPELNHNEIEGYSNAGKGKTPTDHFHFLFIMDDQDHPRVIQRMEITRKLYEEQGLKTTLISLEGKGRFERIFKSLLLADWTAFYTSQQYGLDSEQVPMVEDLKKILK